MFTLPNRYLVKLDANADYLKAFHYPLGMLRITVEKVGGIGEESKSTTRRLFNKRKHPQQNPRTVIC